MTMRTVLSTLLIFVLPLLMLGCDGGGSAMEQEPQQMEELKLSIYHSPESNAQAKSTIERSASELQSGDLLNVFVNGPSSSGNDVSKDAIGFTYPTEGNTAEVVFTVPAGNCDVDLIGFRDLDDPDRNSAVTFATTGDDESVNVTSGNITEVQFDRQGDVLTEFDLSFNATLEFNANDNGNGNKPRQLDVTLQNDSEDPQTSLANRIFPNGSPFGGIGIDPDKIEKRRPLKRKR